MCNCGRNNQAAKVNKPVTPSDREREQRIIEHTKELQRRLDEARTVRPNESSDVAKE